MQIIKLEIVVTEENGFKKLCIYTQATEKVPCTLEEQDLGIFLMKWASLFENQINDRVFNQTIAERLNQMLGGE